MPTKPSSKYPRRIAVRSLLRPGTAALRRQFCRSRGDETHFKPGLLIFQSETPHVVSYGFWHGVRPNGTTGNEPGARPSPGAATLPTKPSSEHPRRIVVRPLLRPGTAALRLRFAVAADVSRLKLLPRWNNERIDPACGTATILEWGARPSRSPFSSSRRKPVNKLICPTMFRARRPKLHARRVRSHNHNFNTSLPSQPSRETQRRPLCVKPPCGR